MDARRKFGVHERSVRVRSTLYPLMINFKIFLKRGVKKQPLLVQPQSSRIVFKESDLFLKLTVNICLFVNGHWKLSRSKGKKKVLNVRKKEWGKYGLDSLNVHWTFAFCLEKPRKLINSQTVMFLEGTITAVFIDDFKSRLSLIVRVKR